jgi:hypothetical protein
VSVYLLEAPLPLVVLEPGYRIALEAVNTASLLNDASVVVTDVTLEYLGDDDALIAAPRQPVFLLPGDNPDASGEPFLGNLPRG